MNTTMQKIFSCCLIPLVECLGKDVDLVSLLTEINKPKDQMPRKIILPISGIYASDKKNISWSTEVCTHSLIPFWGTDSGGELWPLWFLHTYVIETC